MVNNCFNCKKFEGIEYVPDEETKEQNRVIHTKCSMLKPRSDQERYSEDELKVFMEHPCNDDHWEPM